MMSFVSLHLGTIFVGLLLLAGVAGIITHLVREKRRGKSVVCGCACDSCPHAGQCHTGRL